MNNQIVQINNWNFLRDQLNDGKSIVIQEHTYDCIIHENEDYVVILDGENEPSVFLKGAKNIKLLDCERKYIPFESPEFDDPENDIFPFISMGYLNNGTAILDLIDGPSSLLLLSRGLSDGNIPYYIKNIVSQRLL